MEGVFELRCKKKIKQKQIAVRPATFERLKSIKHGSFDQTINLLIDNVKLEEKTIKVIKKAEPEPLAEPEDISKEFE